MTAGWRRRGDTVIRTFDASERDVLESLATGLDETLEQVGRVDDDAVLARLIPPAYQEDEARDEFAGHTAERIAEGKRERLRRILDDVRRSGSQGKVMLDVESARDWLVALNDLRLALAERIGTDRLEDPSVGPVGDVYAWLSWVLSGLIEEVAAVR